MGARNKESTIKNFESPQTTTHFEYSTLAQELLGSAIKIYCKSRIKCFFVCHLMLLLLTILFIFPALVSLHLICFFIYHDFCDMCLLSVLFFIYLYCLSGTQVVVYLALVCCAMHYIDLPGRRSFRGHLHAFCNWQRLGGLLEIYVSFLLCIF